MNGEAIILFPQRDLALSSSEKKVVAKLVEAARIIATIYKKQENTQNNGANFYPRDATKKEIENSAKENPEILSPYTMVERSKNGKMLAIPYHLKFKKELEKISKLILDAAKISEQKDFAKRLRVQADALLDGNYVTSDMYWLSLKPYKINFVIGPLERYDDKLFFKKCSYQSWVGIMNANYTAEAVKFKNLIVGSRRKILAASEKVDFLDKIQVRVDDTLIFSGLIARFMFTSANLPNDVNIMEKHGSEVTIFKPSFDKKFNEERHPIFHSVFDPNFEHLFSLEAIRLGSLRNSYLHEISHPLLRFRDAERRLKEYYPVFDEISASTFGVKSCGSLLLKDAISQSELEAIMLMYIVLGFSWWLSYLKESSVIHYAQGFAIALNYFMECGAIRIVDGKILPNFNKMFLATGDLSDALQRILAIGTYEDAKSFIDKYASFSVFEQFRNSLQGIH